MAVVVPISPPRSPLLARQHAREHPDTAGAQDEERDERRGGMDVSVSARVRSWYAYLPLPSIPFCHMWLDDNTHATQPEKRLRAEQALFQSAKYQDWMENSGGDGVRRAVIW